MLIQTLEGLPSCFVHKVAQIFFLFDQRFDRIYQLLDSPYEVINIRRFPADRLLCGPRRSRHERACRVACSL